MELNVQALEAAKIAIMKAFSNEGYRTATEVIVSTQLEKFAQAAVAGYLSFESSIENIPAPSAHTSFERKLKLIREYRAKHGCSLIEAKQAVESFLAKPQSDNVRKLKLLAEGFIRTLELAMETRVSTGILNPEPLRDLIRDLAQALSETYVQELVKNEHSSEGVGMECTKKMETPKKRKCKGCGCAINHKHPNARFHNQQCKDDYWNKVNPRGYGSEQNDVEHEEGWDAHKRY